jgi:tetratricopeptide (TPR) repeat protein
MRPRSLWHVPRVFGNGLAVLMFIAVSAACGQTSESNAAPANQHVNQNPTESNSNAQDATDAEARDFNAANALTEGIAKEKAADDFARRYPQSTFRTTLYLFAAMQYAGEHDWTGELRAGDKVLAYLPYNAVALALTATALAELLDDSDVNRATKMAAIRERAADALRYVDSDPYPITENGKQLVRSSAYAALGLLDAYIGDHAAAERDFTTATQVSPQQGPYWEELALAQEQLKKYEDGLASIEKALQLANADKAAPGIQQRLKRLASSTVKARLIFGEAVTGSDGEWRFADGTPLPTDLIDGSTGRPPLVPKPQYSTKQAPVAGYIEQIRTTVSSVQNCQGLIPWMQFTASHFDMDDSGIVTSSHPLSTGTDIAYGAALANLNLAKARTVPQKSGCLVVVIPCKGGSCVRLGNRASDEWQIIVQTGDDVNTVLAALSAMAPYYPDGQGEIR